MPDSPSVHPQPRIPIEPIVSFESRVTRGISIEVLNAFHRTPPHGNEAGGILLGRRRGESILVEDFEPVLCEHRASPSYILSDEDLEGLEESVQWFQTSQTGGLQVLGFYRSQARPDSSIDERDNQLMQRFFGEPGSLFLLLKPGRGETITAELFVPAEGSLRPAGHPMLFPNGAGILASVDSAPVDQERDINPIPDAAIAGASPGQTDTGKSTSGDPIPGDPPTENAPVIRASLPPARRRRVETQEIVERNWTWVAALAALTIAGAILGYRSVGPRPVERAPEAVARATPPLTTPASHPIPAPSPGAAVSPEAEQGIRDALAQWERAVRSGDPNLIAACYASQLDLYFNRRNSSNDEVRRAAVQSVARYGKPAILRISDLTLTAVSEDRAIASFRKHWQTSGPRIFAGEEQERLIFVKAEDAWKIASEEETKVYWTQRPRG